MSFFKHLCLEKLMDNALSTFNISNGSIFYSGMTTSKPKPTSAAAMASGGTRRGR
jgi:hypothetical protein